MQIVAAEAAEGHKGPAEHSKLPRVVSVEVPGRVKNVEEAVAPCQRRFEQFASKGTKNYI